MSEASSGEVNGAEPEEATVVHRRLGPAVSERRMAADSRRKATTSSSSRAGIGLPSGETRRPATRANMRASERAWTAAAVLRAARSTRMLTTPAVTRNMVRASTSRASAMVNVWIGGAK
jgi:hypothetical protein